MIHWFQLKTSFAKETTWSWVSDPKMRTTPQKKKEEDFTKERASKKFWTRKELDHLADVEPHFQPEHYLHVLQNAKFDSELEWYQDQLQILPDTCEKF